MRWEWNGGCVGKTKRGLKRAVMFNLRNNPEENKYNVERERECEKVFEGGLYLSSFFPNRRKEREKERERAFLSFNTIQYNTNILLLLLLLLLGSSYMLTTHPRGVVSSWAAYQMPLVSIFLFHSPSPFLSLYQIFLSLEIESRFPMRAQVHTLSPYSLVFFFTPSTLLTSLLCLLLLPKHSIVGISIF